MRQFFLTVAGVFAGLTLFVLALIASLIVMSASLQASGERSAGMVPRETVLTLDLRDSLPDQSALTPFSSSRPPSLIGLVEALERAETDDRVKGVFIRASESGLDAAQAEEIHDALLSLRARGKFIITHAQGFETTSIMSYLAASASSEIWLQPTSNFVATGLGVETPFFGGVFEKFGVEPEFEQFHQYKNAVNSYTETGYTEAHAEAVTELLESIYDASIESAAKARRERGATPDSLRALLEGAPYSAERALDLGLVDHLGHVVDAREAVIDAAGEQAELMDVFDYARAAGGPYHSGPVIALIAGQGDVVTGEGSPSFLGAASGIYSDTIADAILDAADDRNVRAIVLRIDSPGGSAIASDQIWDAVERARANGKPVVASFGSTAASGGYYMAAGADAIVARANTITGSIGVYGGKFVLDGVFDSVGFNLEPLSVGGDYTLAYATTREFTPEQRAAFHDMLAEVYDDFTGRVAQGRDLDPAVVDRVANGRVWSGADALERGLVDEIGGYRDAIDRAKELAGLSRDADVTLRRLPVEESPLELLQSLLGVSAETTIAIRDLQALANQPEIQAALTARRSVGTENVLRAPAIEIR